MPVEEHPKNPDLDDAEDPEVEGFGLLDGLGLPTTPGPASAQAMATDHQRRSISFKPKVNRAAQLINKHNG